MSRYFEEFTESAAGNANAPAIAGPGGAQTTYSELLEEATRFAAYLQSGPAGNGIVPILAGKSGRSIALSLGCLAAGRPFAWLNQKLKGPQVRSVLEASRVEACVVDPAAMIGLARVIAASPELRRVRWLLLPSSESWAEDLVARLRVDNIDAHEIELPGRTRRTFTGIGCGEAACCLFTSGSTGKQKGVLISDSDLLNRARSESEWYELSSSDRLLSVLPFAFDVGLNQLLSGLLSGSCLVLQDSWLPNDIVRNAINESISGISGVPAVWRDMLALPDAESTAILAGGHLRYITISGGSLAPAEQQDLMDRLGGVEIFKTYGQTETFRSASARHADLAERPESVGRPWGGSEVLILDSNLEQCAPGEVGEIVHVGPGTMLGYVGESGAVDKLKRLPDDLGGRAAVFTGDYGFLDDDGYLHLKGRKDDMVKIAGNRVYLEEVAAQLRSLTDVQEAEVLSLGPKDGEPRIVAFLTGAANEDDVRKAAAKCLPPYMMPTRFCMTQRIPRLPNGKPDRIALLDQVQGTL